MVRKCAIVEVGHSILFIVYHIQKNNIPYSELGADYFDKRNEEGLTRYYVKRLENLGHQVTIENAA